MFDFFLKILKKVLTYTHLMCIIERRRLVKQRELIRRLEAAGFVFERHGSNHDIYVRGDDKEEVPRHKEVNEFLAKAILRKWRLM